jgi:serine/arginine repetitive matrix protein 1
MHGWVAQKLTGMLGFEDEVVIGLVNNMLDSETHPDPRELQVTLTGFLEKRASEFVLDLWKMLISAQTSATGIPSSLLDEKKAQISAQQAADKSLVGAAAADIAGLRGSVAAALSRHASNARSDSQVASSAAAAQSSASGENYHRGSRDPRDFRGRRSSSPREGDRRDRAGGYDWRGGHEPRDRREFRRDGPHRDSYYRRDDMDHRRGGGGDSRDAHYREDSRQVHHSRDRHHDASREHSSGRDGRDQNRGPSRWASPPRGTPEAPPRRSRSRTPPRASAVSRDEFGRERVASTPSLDRGRAAAGASPDSREASLRVALQARKDASSKGRVEGGTATK